WRRGRRRVPEVLGADGQALAPVLLAVLREQQHRATGPDQPTDPGH
ncbi:ABC transporter ATP-binding protein, partial [Propionibacterium freudenreichii]|nr:ABC transporter ATP-binding protein [Propionibacterium freudenreichii]